MDVRCATGEGLNGTRRKVRQEPMDGAWRGELCCSTLLTLLSHRVHWNCDRPAVWIAGLKLELS
jgi:hypothetical protein